MPSSGVIKVYSSRSGTIESIYVKGGSKVQKGELIAKVLLSRPQLNGIDLSETLLSGLKSQLSLLEQDEKNTVLVAKLDLQRLKQKVLDLTETEKVLERQQLLLDKNTSYNNKSLSVSIKYTAMVIYRKQNINLSSKIIANCTGNGIQQV
ncbi:hypothetical protein TUM17377_37580 [Shewanella chilikensis]|nr:hypothetical protein TUM17377_37580 [Shewanella chilikensis]